MEWYGGSAYERKIAESWKNADPDDIEVLKQVYPEWFDSNGNYIPSKVIEAEQLHTRNSLEYCIKTQSLNHGNEYNTAAVSSINSGGSGYDPKQWVENIKQSPAHWEILMSKSLTTLYVVYETQDGSNFVFSVN